MIATIIIDDEPLACKEVESYISELPGFEIKAVCNNGYEGLKAIQLHRPDLLFLDVQMPKITGFEMLELLDQMPAVIFTTAFDEYAMKAFEAHAVDYLLKPFSRERFMMAIAKFQKLESNHKPDMAPMVSTVQSPVQNNRIVIRDGGRIRIIALDEIICLEADDDYVKVNTSNGSFLKKKTMNHYEETLPSGQFLRVHRSYLVNVGHITRIDPYEKNSHLAVLKNGTKIPVSRSGFQRLKEVLDI